MIEAKFFNIVDDDYNVPEVVNNEGCYPVLTPTYNKEKKKWFWVLVQDWCVDYDNGRYRFIIPAGTITDGASIPRMLWTICGSPMELPRAIASLLHDYLYVNLSKENPDPDCQERKFADKVYRDLNIQLGMGKRQAKTEYNMLRWFAGSHWNSDM